MRPTLGARRQDQDVDAEGRNNDLARPVGTHLYGRRMYETMAAWESVEDERPVIQDFAEIWRAAEKVVYSRSLESVSSARTRIERNFDPEEIRRLKEGARADITVGGSDLAGQAINAGLVDEYRLFLAPVLVGGGKRALPDGVRVELELLDVQRFAGGVVFLPVRPPLGSAGRADVQPEPTQGG